MNKQKHVIRTERIWLKPHPNLLRYCHLSKNLFNEANYIVRQAFFSERTWIKAAELHQHLLESPNFKTLPLATTVKILQLVEQMWKSFFNSTIDWKKHPEKYFRKPRPPKYKRKDGECILHQIFGSKANEGIISVFADPICSITHKTAEIPERVQKVHIASENRVNLTYNGKSIQDFNERYFSGYFTFEINLTKCSSKQIGLILEGVMKFDRLGRGYNSGYGHIEVKKLQLLRRTISLKPVISDDGSFIIEKEINEKPLKELFRQSLEAWRNGTTT